MDSQVKMLSGPFEFPKLTEEYPLYSRQLAEEIRKIDFLPDFSDDKSIFAMSDYGGEHNAAAFNTYVFLIVSVDKLSTFNEKMLQLRDLYGLNNPFKEYAYKDLQYGPIKRSLNEYLNISDKFIYGVLVTISIDKSIPTMFGIEKNETQNQIVKIIYNEGLGNWKKNDAEKLLRVCHPLAMFLALLVKSGQKYLWMSDKDVINEDGKNHNFENTRNIFVRILRLYTDIEYDIHGFAKPFDRDPFTYDLLSLSDLAAGTIQEILQDQLKNRIMKLNEEKETLVKWLGTSSPFLKKVNLFFERNEETWRIGNVKLSEK